MCAYQLIAIFTEDQVTDLTLGGQATELCALLGIPEADAAVCSATSTDKESALVG
jgi:hypothetical protein